MISNKQDRSDAAGDAASKSSAEAGPSTEAGARDGAAIPVSSSENPAGNATGNVTRHRYGLPLTLCVLALALLTAGIVPRLHAATALADQVQSQSTMPVTVVSPKPAPSTQELLLPGAVSAFSDAAIFARTSGYISRWNTDIGATVKKGDVLAIVHTPELDAQLRQAQADLETAKANYADAKATAERWQTLLQTQSVSVQDAQTRTSDMQAKRAMVASASANVQRLAELVSYESIRAPFDGMVTTRNVDVGVLVTAGGSPGLSANAGELFHVQQVNTLRVYADVPQDDAAYISPDTSVYLTTAQYPGRQFPAHVARDAGSINPSSRTLHVEVDVANGDHSLMPGAYVQIHFALSTSHPALDLPVSAILFRPDGLNVVVVGPDNKTVLKKITVSRDFGTSMEVTQGVSATDRVIDNPSDSITSGETVQVTSAGT